LSIIVHPDGRTELTDVEALEVSKLYNKDLAPVPIASRTWSTYHFASLWAGMACNIPTYMIASGLIASGMNWWQALLCVLLGNCIVLVPILLNSHAGAKYGIPFPVLARASYGVLGSNLPAMMRALVACGWFGINAWIGGQATHALIKTIIPNWDTALGAQMFGHTPTEWISFFLFWFLNIFVIYHGMEALKKFECLAAPFVFTMTGSLVVWSVLNAHGLGTLMSQPGKFESLQSFLPIFIPSVTAMVGSWATLSLNMPDFTRFSRGQKEQTIGQAIALPLSMTLLSAMGIIITSAAIIIFPHMKPNELWVPVKIIGQFSQPMVVALAMFTIMTATIAVNIAANVVSPANDFANLLPRWISFRRGAILTAVIALFMQPWNLMADPQAYIFKWLLGYAGGLGSIAGIMIVDYWVIRKKTLDLQDLYLQHGDYEFSHGINWIAVVSTCAGCFFAWIGQLVPALKILFDYSWFVGLIVSSALYYGLTVVSRGSKQTAKT
jgi:NCS1 family nucleobase:cation symporter-1